MIIIWLPEGPNIREWSINLNIQLNEKIILQNHLESQKLNIEFKFLCAVHHSK